jgi:hypothetical protein
MKNTVIPLLVVAVGSLGSFAYFQEASLQARGGAAPRLVSRLASLSATTSPDPREMCAQRARQETNHAGRANEPRAFFTNYYDERLNRCFIEIENIGVSNKAGGVFINKSLTDADGVEYAAYLAFSKRAKESWDVPPSICEIYLSSGEETECHSADEFDELVTDYIKR